MRKPRLLDLFCGAGGAAMGYARAGFEVVGVDIATQPHYPFEFHQGDAITFPLEGYDAIHASPPCQGYSRMRHLPWLKDNEYPMLIEPVRARLRNSGVPWVIENVEDAPLDPSFVLCGTMFDLPLYRHRRFESNMLVLSPQHDGKHRHVIWGGRKLGSRYSSNSGGVIGVFGHVAGPGIEAARDAMGIDWMTRDELIQAIPPAYTEFIGAQLLAALESAA
jgi:DNA (cytosine-5)-methyltransferase 1